MSDANTDARRLREFIWMEWFAVACIAGNAIAAGLNAAAQNWLIMVTCWLWGAAAAMMFAVSRRNRATFIRTNEIAAFKQRYDAQEEMTALAAQGECPKCGSALAATIHLACTGCNAGFRLKPTDTGMFLVDDPDAPAAPGPTTRH